MNAEAAFTFNVTNQTITVELLNLQMKPGTLGQLAGGLDFDLTNLSPGALSSAVVSATESTFDVGSNGAPTASQDSSTWTSGTIGKSTLSLCQICNPGSGGTVGVVIGTLDSATGSEEFGNPRTMDGGAAYSTGPLQGINAMPKWVLSVPLITGGTSISQVRFYVESSGISYDVSTNAVGITPEPGPTVLILSGLLLVAGGRFSQRLSKS